MLPCAGGVFKPAWGMGDFLHRLAFIDETSLKTNMIKKTGWAPRGERLIDHAPHGHWNTQTFIAALRHDRLDAPWILKGAMDREMFDLYIETQLAPTLHKGDVVILDNLPVHKFPKSRALLKGQRNRFLLLPRHGPDSNPIDMAFFKLKALIRKTAARSCDDLWQARRPRLRSLHRRRMLQFLQGSRISTKLN